MQSDQKNDEACHCTLQQIHKALSNFTKSANQTNRYQKADQ